MNKKLIVSVPASIPVEDLVDQLGLSRIKAESIKFKMYYFISLLVSTNENSHLNEKNDGYRHIYSVRMRKILGRKEYYMILKVLLDSPEPYIESNHSWQKSTKHNKGTSMGYRLTYNHIHSELDYKTLPEKLQARINKHLNPGYNFDDSSYQFLYDQFHKHSLTLDPRVYDYVYRFGSTLLSRVRSGNIYQTKMIHNLIGKWLDKLGKIRDNDWRPKVSRTNHRLNSSLTSLNKALRKFVLCDGCSLGMIDISASHPYFMASTISNSFLQTDVPGYNLKTIYPQLFDALVSNNSIITDDSYFSGYSSYSGSTAGAGYYSSSGSSTGELKSKYSFMWGHFFNEDQPESTSYSSSSGSSMGELKSKYSFMWGHFSNENELESIRKYQQSPFDSDFYKHYIISNYSFYPDQSTDEEGYRKFREKIKKDMMYVMDDKKKSRRKHIAAINTFRDKYPGVDKWITSIIDLKSDLSVSYLLQRTESYMVLQVICQEFHSKFPEAPIFTIHDAICSYPEYLKDLQELISTRFYEITGIRVGLKTELFTPDTEPKFEDIEEKWKKICSVDCESKYRDAAFKVHPANIERGSQFMQNFLSGERKLA